MSRIPLALAAAVAFASTFASCGFEPSVPVQRHELNLAYLRSQGQQYEPLLEDPAALDQLRGALDMLFGTPQNPRYLLLDDWIDDGYDPNHGEDEISDEGFEAIRASNRDHFHQQIEAIRAGRYDDVLKPLYAPRLWARWQAHLANLPDDPNAPDPNDPEYTWLENAVYLFEGFYPTLAESAVMFRQQCQHCHGVSGGANGSTAPYLEPRPRDYRHGKFKFTALRDKARPRREDLFRVLTEGIYTTAMPSFRRFSDAQLEGLVDYVRLLAIRGETELLLFDKYDAELGGFGGMESIREEYAFVHSKWRESEDKVIVYDGDVPHSTRERVEHGKQLFLGGEGSGANCASCHGEDGRGGGPSAFEVDPVTGEPVRVKDDWGNEISPRDLTRGIFRFGRRPIDLYRRIYAGINGTPMPEHIGMQITEADGTQRSLDENDVWDLVCFVRSLSVHAPGPFKHRLPDDEHETGGAHGSTGL